MNKEDNPDYKEILRLLKRKFWIRIGFFIIVLGLLVWVGIQGGGDPCSKCKLQISYLGDKEYDCREMMEEFILPKYIIDSDSVNPLFNITPQE